MLERELEVKPELVEGDRGEFAVLVGDDAVIRKGLIFFPADKKVLNAVRRAMAS